MNAFLNHQYEVSKIELAAKIKAHEPLDAMRVAYQRLVVSGVVMPIEISYRAVINALNAYEKINNALNDQDSKAAYHAAIDAYISTFDLSVLRNKNIS